MSKYRIAVVGLGGVGGFIGGRLADQYGHGSEVEIIFVARGTQGEVITEHGLTLITADGEKTVRPSAIVPGPERLGTIDLLICAIKGYDLNGMAAFRSCVGARTSVLPLLNGVNAAERLQGLLPEATIWGGCIYIFSRIVKPGVVQFMGKTHSLFLGAIGHADPEIDRVAQLMVSAGVNAQAADNIVERIWEKFVFVSPLATLTSALNQNVGQILGKHDIRERLARLVNEAISVARAKHVVLDDDIAEKTLAKYEALVPDTTSSMHTDFQLGRRTEADLLTGYVCQTGESLRIPTPEYVALWQQLTKKSIGANQ